LGITRNYQPMSLWNDFTRSLSLRADAGLGVQLPPWDDYWFSNRGYQTATGLRVSPDNALRMAAVFACVRVTSETVASLPCIIYRRLSDGGKERATNHPLYKILHDSPNQWQTAYEFLEMMQAHLELRGNAYAEIVSGNGRAIDALIPIHPDRVMVKRMSDGRLKYEIRNFYNGSLEVRMQEEMLHLRGLSADGLVGMSTVSVMAESIGAGLAAQEFAARFFENDQTPSGVLIHPKNLSEAAYARMKASWREQQSGANQHSLKIIEEGMTYQNIGVTNKDSQLLEARQFSRADIASGFRVPLHKIGDLTRATFSNIEQQNIEFATDCVRPRAVRLERRIKMSLIDPLGYGVGEEYFAEFLMEALMRGDQPSRYRSYATARQWGWMSVNDVRAAESMNPIENGDEYLQPLNMGTAASDNPDQSDETSDQVTDSTGTGAHLLRDFVYAAAQRVIRKEVKAITRISEKANGHFSEQIAEFYRGHRDFVAETMRIAWDSAAKYAEQHERLLAVESDVRESSIRKIESEGAERLMHLALSSRRRQLQQPQSISPIQVTIEPQTINVTPQISIAQPSITMEAPQLTMGAEQSQPGRRKRVTATRDEQGRLNAVIEEEFTPVCIRATRTKDGVKIDAN
jgi:HK97 family phage portal protein